MRKTEPPIIVEQSFESSIEKLWSAITTHAEMVQWFFENIPAFEPKVGFQTQFDVQSAERLFPHVWKIIEVEPLEKITYDWRYEGYQGTAKVTFELFEQDSHSLLILTHTVLEDFSDDIPEFKRESGVEGWNYFIKDRLVEYMNNT